ncbi:MAG: DUF1080 domain-containing protein [Acidobacteria bacterium]|nr:DUF1080 domain-containing protein [Acidobacteriota bacterium]
MKHRILPTVLGVACFGLAAVAGFAREGWKPLFNGKDLSGWRAYGNEKWTVENGSILGEAVTDKYGYLVTENTYRDFELRVKFKCDAAGNYGLFFRSRMKGEGKWGPDIEGLQAEIDPSRDTAGIYESAGREWLAKPTPEALKIFKPFDWNELEVVAKGGHLTTRLNGKTIVDYQDPAPRFHDGVIGLQLHSGGGMKIHFRDIEIKVLEK